MPGAGAWVLATLDTVDAVLADSPTALGWLSPSEAVRLQGITAPQRRRQFLAGRWLARRLLARYAGEAGGPWGLEENPGGPPTVAAPPGGASPRVALSHSGDWVACAVSWVGLLGIDVEQTRPGRDLEGLAEICLHPDETARWHGTPLAEREQLFYQLWTLKEAWVKSRMEALAPARLAALRTRVATAADRTVVHCLSGVPGPLACALVAPRDTPVAWASDGTAPVSSVAMAVDDSLAADVAQPASLTNTAQ